MLSRRFGATMMAVAALAGMGAHVAPMADKAIVATNAQTPAPRRRRRAPGGAVHSWRWRFPSSKGDPGRRRQHGSPARRKAKLKAKLRRRKAG